MKVEMKRVVAGVAAMIAAMGGGKAAVAQAPAPQNDEELEVVTVSSSRLRISGYDAPTPVSMVSEEDIKKAAPVNIADYVNQLPQLAGSLSPRTTKGGIAGNLSGGNFLNLRNLGVSRTLVLLDGRRFTPSTLTGAVDVNNIPTPLISRVDVVTGGASAAWGSDAVAGVTNFVLNKGFEGIKGSLNGGTATEGDAQNVAADLSFGKAFAEGRGHVLLSGQYSDVKKSRFVDRDWFQSYKVAANPNAAAAGQPALLFLPWTTQLESEGGVVTAGPLTGYYFNRDGTFGGTNFPLTNRSGNFIFNDKAAYDRLYDTARNDYLSLPMKQQSLFGRVSYDFSDAVSAFGEVSYGKSDTSARIAAYNRPANLVVAVDNFYLPATVRQAMVAAGQTSITIGSAYPNMGTINNKIDRDNLRILGGLEGTFGEGWKWDVSYQHGRSKVDQAAEEMPRPPTFTLATDSIANPANPSQPICRSTITTPTDGCVPMNPFGAAPLSAQQLAYVAGVGTQGITYDQTVAAANLSGDLMSLPAGALSLAAGVEYREEKADATADPISQASAFWAGNFKAFNGKYDVKEAYVELGAPVFKDTAAGSLDVNVAGRFTDYSTAGNVSTWKAGLLYSPVESVTVRVTRSRDIRAPNLNELFTPGLVTNQIVNDPLNNNLAVRFVQTLGGNPNLDPERADTTIAGIVLQPDFAPKLRASIDWYNIKINDAIATNTSQFLVNRCAAGATEFCVAIRRDSANQIVAVGLTPFNAQVEETSGIDLEVSYGIPLGGGNLDLRMFANYVNKLQTVTQTTTITRAGEAGNNSGAGEGTPKLRGSLTATYSRNAWTFQMTGRYIGSAKMDDAWDSVLIGGVSHPGVADNHVSAVMYLDGYAGFKLEGLNSAWKGGEFYLAATNLLNKDPPMIPLQDNSNTVASGTNPFLYDVLGTTLRAGVRFEF